MASGPRDEFEEISPRRRGYPNYPAIVLPRSSMMHLLDDLVADLRDAWPRVKSNVEDTRHYRACVFSWPVRQGVVVELGLQVNNYGCTITLGKAEDSDDVQAERINLATWVLRRDFLYPEGGRLKRNNRNYILICRDNTAGEIKEPYRLTYYHESLSGIPRFNLPLFEGEVVAAQAGDMVDDIIRVTNEELELAKQT